MEGKANASVGSGLLILLFFFLSFSSAAQVAQWRGEMRDGKFGSEKKLLKSWPAEGPELLLKVDNLGKGFSSPIMADNIIYITGLKDTLDYISAVDMEGNILWQRTYGVAWKQSYPDTRTSPTIDGERIYVFSGSGRLSCLNRADGSVIWAVEVDRDYESEWHLWGISESPLVDGDRVICSPGGAKTSVVAFDKMTGKEVWRTEPVGGPRCYISPVIYEYDKFRLILAATGQNLIAIVPETGKVAWSYQYWSSEKWDQSGLIWANTPIFYKDEIFISMGYDYKAVMLKMNNEGTGVTEKFFSDVLDNHHHGVIVHDGYLYGSNWINNGKGNWVCLDWNTGEVKWETTWENKGSIVFSDGMFYLYEEKRGNVGLLLPDPEKFNLVSSFRITDGSGPHWAHPFIRDGKMFLRHGEVLMVFKIQ
jgi:outer membrane protein assembly factor BamB